MSTVYGTGCETIFDLEYASSCYCRHRKPGDVGKVGATLPGNRIFNSNDQCILFKPKGPTVVGRDLEETAEGVVKRSRAVESRRESSVVVVAAQIVGLMLVMQMIWR